jgi:hypothetical protein
MAFIYGGDTGIADPQELQRRRAVIDALGQRAASNRPRSVGEGLNAIGESLFAVIGEKRLAKKEATARKQATDKFGRVTSALLGGQGYAAPSMAASAPMQGVTTPQVQTTPLTANPAGLPQSIIGAVDRVDPQGGGALSPEQVKAGLVQRGLAPHVADGFVMNFGDESGLDPGINEIAPTVPGSRGGFGLAQWTGPRRVALEKFATERGASVADPNVQIDFLMMELQGPEAKAAQGIMSAPDANSAAQAIVRDFLRPAPENLDRRMAEYGGFSTPPAMAGGDPTAINQLAELSANPYLPEGQRAVVDALLQKQLAQIGQVDDPLKAIELQKAQLELQQMQTGRGGTTELSLTPQYGTDANGNLVMLQVGKDGKAVQTVLPEGVALTRGIEKIDLGDSFVFMNTLTGETIGEPVAKNLAEAERQKGIGTATGKMEGTAAAEIEGARLKTQQALDLIDKIAADPALPSITGTIQGGILAPGIPMLTGGQAGSDLAARIENLQGKVFVQAYDSIRGAGQITEQEGAAAQAAIENLKRTQGTEAYKAALETLKQTLTDLLAVSEAKAARGGAAPAAGDLSDDDFLKSLGLE